MGKKRGDPLHKHTFNLFAGDIERLQALLDAQPIEKRLNASEFMRKFLRQYLMRVEKKANPEDHNE